MKAALEARALLLRRNGKGIKDIARTLGVSSSTASRWCKPVVLSKEQIATTPTYCQFGGTSSLD